MPSHHYQDFPAMELGLIKQAVSDSSAALVKAKAALAKPVYGGQHITDLETYFKRWFGAFTAPNVATVNDVVTNLRNAICVGKMWIKYCTLNENLNPGGVPDIACPPNENASAFRSAGAVGFAASRSRVGYQNSIFICPRMLHQMAKQGVDRQSIAGTLIHEMSHAVAGTFDVVQGGATVYGADAAKALASNPAGAVQGNPPVAATALTNAENYGFFCMEFLEIKR